VISLDIFKSNFFSYTNVLQGAQMAYVRDGYMVLFFSKHVLCFQLLLFDCHRSLLFYCHIYLTDPPVWRAHLQGNAS